MRPGARVSGLPFGLERYNVVYMAALSCIVLGGTLYSIIYMTHHYNVILSDPIGALARAQAQAREGKQAQSSLESFNELMDASKYMPSMPGTLLADRKNFINRIFVKLAWLWTTAAFLLQAATLRNISTGSASSAHASAQSLSETSATSTAETEKLARRNGLASRRVNGGSSTSSTDRPSTSATRDPASIQATVMGLASISLLRFAVATTMWILFSRWFFGPAVMERVRSVSGAICVPVNQFRGAAANTSSAALDALRASLPDAVDAAHCYAGGSMLSAQTHPEAFAQAGLSEHEASSVRVRANWRGGHDISGHTFILIISTLYLLEELTPFLPHLLPAAMQRYAVHFMPRALWAPVNPYTVAVAGSLERARVNKLVTLTVLSLIGVWTMSLFVTSIFFHTPQEKISGLALALICSLALPKGG